MEQGFNHNKTVLDFQTQRVFANISREILLILEDLKYNHNSNFDKLYSNLPPEFLGLIDMANYFDNKNYENYRKKILDKINTCRRDFENNLNNK